MKKLLFVFVLGFLPVILFSQNKGFVYKPSPSEFTTAAELDAKRICVKLKDARVLHPKTKVSCAAKELQGIIINGFNNAFSSTIFGVDEADVVLEITIKQYETFARGVVWVGITEYEMKLQDEGKVLEKTIKGTHSEGNVMGKSTGKKVLQKSFDKANLESFNWLIEIAN
jgi:hypothetical protein